MTVNAAQKSNSELHDFHEQLKAILPRLRVYALSLTRDRDAADDLVHDTVIKALTGRESFAPRPHPLGRGLPHPAKRIHLRPAPHPPARAGRLGDRRDAVAPAAPGEPLGDA